MNKMDKTRRRVSRNHYKVKAVAGEGRVRLSIFRANENIYAQIIDDAEGKTLVSSSSVDKKLRKDLKNGGTVEAAQTVGAELAKRALAAGIKDVYCDRGGRRYHGRIKALADAARNGGLNF